LRKAGPISGLLAAPPAKLLASVAVWFQFRCLDFAGNRTVEHGTARAAWDPRHFGGGRPCSFRRRGKALPAPPRRRGGLYPAPRAGGAAPASAPKRCPSIPEGGKNFRIWTGLFCLAAPMTVPVSTGGGLLRFSVLGADFRAGEEVGSQKPFRHSPEAVFFPFSFPSGGASVDLHGIRRLPLFYHGALCSSRLFEERMRPRRAEGSVGEDGGPAGLESWI